MDNPARLFDQIAAEAGITAGKAKVVAYLFGLSQHGATISSAAAALRRKPDTIKAIAREFVIDFADYRPFEREEKKTGGRPEPRVKIALGA